MIPLLLWLGVARAACPGFDPGPADADFRTRPQAGATLVLEIPVEEGDAAAELEALLAPLTAREAWATVLVAPSAAASLAPALRAAAAAGHEVGARIVVDPKGPLAARSRDAFERWWATLRQERRAVRRASRAPVRVVAASPLTEPAELAAVQAGVRVLLPLEGAGPLRRVRGFDGRPGRTRVLPGPAHADGCGVSLPAWTPAAFDRAAVGALPGQASRVALPLAGARPALLAAWLDEMVGPAGVPVEVASAAALQARPAAADAPAKTPGRPVDRAMWEAAAARLLEGGRLPRTLPGSLNLTEAWAALVQVVAAPTPPPVVRLPDLAPPADVARSQLPPGGLDLDPDDVRAAAAALAPRLRGSVPAMVAVGPHSLTAGELLVALAAVATGAPPRVAPSPPPDPFAEGGGWGRSGAP